MQTLFIAQPQRAVWRPVARCKRPLQLDFLDAVGSETMYIADQVAYPNVAGWPWQHSGMVERFSRRQGLQTVGPQSVQPRRSSEPDISFPVLKSRLGQRTADTILQRQALGRHARSHGMEFPLNPIWLHQPHVAGAVELHPDAPLFWLGRIMDRRFGGADPVIVVLGIDCPNSPVRTFGQVDQQGARPCMGEASLPRPSEENAVHGPHPLRSVAAKQYLIYTLGRQVDALPLRLKAGCAGCQTGGTVTRTDPDGAIRRHFDVKHRPRW